MLAICEKIADDVTRDLRVGTVLTTPDRQVGSQFEIIDIDLNAGRFQIRFAGGNQMWIAQESLAAALDYLIRNSNFAAPGCIIAAHNDENQAGNLDLATRLSPNAPRNVTYVLPILQYFGLVTIDGNRPNKVWLA